MANRMPVVSASWATGTGIWYGSEIQIGVAATLGAPVLYLSASTATTLASQMPGVFMLSSTLDGTASTGLRFQYSPDSGTTWRNAGIISSSTVIAVLDGSANFRILGGGTAANVFFVPLKVLT